MRAKTKTCFSLEDHQSSHSAAASIGSNDDLLTEILVCLPVISILRFKCVSKHLQSLLSHPTFTRRYDTRHFPHKSPLGLFTYNDVYVPFDDEDPTEPPFRNLNFFSDPNGIRVLQYCNGLLLCCSEYGHTCDRKYYVLNPTTRQFVMIPLVLGGKTARNSIRFMGLTFDQTGSAHYKLVCVLVLEYKPAWVSNEIDGEELFQIQAYSSDTREWKISIESLSARCSIFRGGVYWNGAFNWALSDLSYLYFKVDVGQLHSLSGPVEMMPLPGGETHKRYFGESGGHLHLIVPGDSESDSFDMNVYEMMMDHSGWFVKYHLEIDVPNAFPDMIVRTPFDFIDLIRGDLEEDTFIVLLVHKKLFTYKVHDRSVKQIFNFDCIYMGSGLYEKYFPRYAPTLASL